MEGFEAMGEPPGRDTGPDGDETRPEGVEAVAVGAEGLGLKGSRGWVFRDVAFDAEPGALIAVEGPSGSGRTCLLLTLTGRMKPSEGHATVGSLRLPKQMATVRRISALAHVPGVTDLEPALTVEEHLRERALLQRRFDGSLRGLLRPRAERAAEARLRIDTALAAAGLDRTSPAKGARTAVRDLDRLEALRLSVALALVGRPRLLGVDDADLKLSGAERAEMWALLRSLTESGVTVVAVCSEAPEGAVVVSTAPGKPARAREDVLETPAQDDDEETADALAGTGRA
jgi:ABC-type multidrug transport system ATPase subunit